MRKIKLPDNSQCSFFLEIINFIKATLFSKNAYIGVNTTYYLSIEKIIILLFGNIKLGLFGK